MGNKVTIGGNRLGSGKRMTTNLKSYERSTHNLGYLWRSTMAPGTLVPFMVEPALPGDTWDIGLSAETLTLPTIGPLFGSFKLQLDVFCVPIRLYQAQLHNNKLYIGLNMDQIKLPLLELKSKSIDFTSDTPIDIQQINPSSLLAYLGIRGLGKSPDGSWIKRYFDATPLLAYWDIYKNYYANKQEEIGVFIHKSALPAPTFSTINGIDIIAGVPDETVELTESTTFTLIGTNFDENTDFSFQLNGTTVVRAKDIFSSYRIVSPTQVEFTNVLISWIDQAISLISGVNTVQDVNLVQFDLSNLDDMREDILSAIKTTTAFTITGATYAPYGSILGTQTTEFGPSASVMEGLAIKTYQSDIFNNWMSTEFIDGVNGINAITSIDTSEGKFSIDTLNLAKKVYALLNDIALSGGSYEDWIEAAWDIDTMRKAETPMYEGGLSREIVFNEVISNSASEQTLDSQIEPLGTLGGRGVMSDKNKGGKLVIKVQEPSYIIGIVSITPRVDYCQGNRWYTNLKTLNDFHKPALDEIGFQDLVTDQMAFWDTTIDPSTDAVTFKSAGKQPAWINYQTNFNRVYGNFADQDKEMFMVLNRRYEHNGTAGIKDLTTYIDPVKFNYAFASTNLDAQNFWTHIAVDAEVRRKMSAKIMPNP